MKNCDLKNELHNLAARYFAWCVKYQAAHAAKDEWGEQHAVVQLLKINRRLKGHDVHVDVMKWPEEALN